MCTCCLLHDQKFRADAVCLGNAGGVVASHERTAAAVASRDEWRWPPTGTSAARALRSWSHGGEGGSAERQRLLARGRYSIDRRFVS